SLWTFWRTCRRYHAYGKSETSMVSAPVPTGEPVAWPSVALGAGRESTGLSILSAFSALGGGATFAVRGAARGGHSLSPPPGLSVRAGRRGVGPAGSGTRAGGPA